MSRTKRFKHDAWLIDHNSVLTDWIWEHEWFMRGSRVRIDPSSKEGRRRLARMHSDAKKGVMRWRGPSWFVHEYHQVPYRQRARQELHKFMKNPEYEVQLESKPHLTYWY